MTNETSTPSTYIWRGSLSSYPPKLRAIFVFASPEEEDKACELFWDEDHPLYGVPHDVTRDGLALPREAAPFLTQANIQFEMRDYPSPAKRKQ